MATPADELQAVLETQRLASVQQASQAAVAADPGLPQRVSDIAKAAPFLPPGIVTSLAKAQQTPTDQTTTTAAQRSYQQALLSWRPAKATSRAVLTALSAPWQEVQGLQRDAVAYGDQLGGQPGKAAGGTLAGAGTGALAGGLVGSVVPVIGTGIGAAVGGLVGGIAGFFGSRDVQVKKGFQYQAQSALGIELGDLLRGKPVNAGTGFFAGKDIAAEQIRRASEVTVDGKPFTGGRLIVAGVPDNYIEPGTRPYSILSGLVDAAAVIKGDPAALGLSAAGGAIKATRYFGEAGTEVSHAGALQPFGASAAERLGAGLVNGLRQETIPQQTARWLDGPAGQRVLEAINNAGSATEIWKGLGKQAPFEVAAKLADAQGDPAAIRTILDGELGTTVRQKPTWGSLGSTVIRKVTLGYVDPMTNRLMPNFGPLPKDNPDAALEQFDRLLSAGRVPPEAAARHLDNLGRAMLATPGDWSSKAVNAMTGGLKDIYNNILARQGSDPLTREAAAEITGLFNSSKTASGYLVDELGHNASPFEMQVNGKGIQVPRPHSFLEHTAGQVWLPNARDIARNTSRFANILTNPAAQATGESLRYISGQIWKPLELLKMGTSLRILADTQESMDARGLSSLFGSPMDLLGWAVGQSDSKVSKLLGNFIESRGSTDALGELMADHAEFAATSGSVRRALDPVGQARASGRMLFQNGQAQFSRVWADEVNHLTLDPIHTAAARMSTQDFTDWLDTGPGAKYREAMVSPSKAELSNIRGPDQTVKTTAADIPKADYYHGTSKPLPGGQLDPDRYMAGSGATNLFGPGTYVTDNPNVALSYTDKGFKSAAKAGEEGKTVYGIRWKGTAPPNLIDLSQPIPKGARQAFLSSFEAVPYEYPPSELAKLATKLETTPGDAVYQELRQDMADEGWSRASADEHLEDLHLALQDAGYDGFRYQGGKYTKSPIQHEATVFFDPGKLETTGGTPITTRTVPGPHLNPDYPQNLSRYVQSVYDRIDKATQGDDDLRAIIQRGAKGEVMSGGPEGVRPAIDKAVGRLYAEVDDQGQHTFAPNFLTGYMEGTPEAEAKANKLKVARDWLFDQMMTKPLNFFTNHPAYAQTYWREIDRLYPLMDPAAQAEVAANAAKANVTLGNLGTTQAGKLSAEEANVVAKGHVVADVKSVIHNLSDRSQLADKLAVVSPFLDATQKIVARWSKALFENPEYLRKLQMVQQAGADSGFLHQNDYGQEVFSFPLANWATRTVTGLPVDIQGDPSRGLPLVHNLLPSIGPALSIPLGALIKDKPGWQQGARDFLDLGYGAGTTPNWFKSAERAFSPADPQTDRTYLNAVKNAMRYTAYEHPQQYDLGTNLGQAKLIHDSKLRASGIFMVQMLGQFFSPAGSNLVDMTKDPAGHWITATALGRDFQARKTAMGTSDAAVQSMLNDYGDSVFLYLQSPNQTNVPGAPVTREASNWIKANPAVKDAYPDLYALLAPAQGAFDPGVYAQSFQDGTRSNLTPQQFIQLGEARLGNLIYAQASATVGTRRTPAVNQALSTLRQALADKYPGYGKTVGKPVDWTSAEPQIEQAVTDPAVTATPAGQGLVQYWAVRTAAMQALNNAGLTSFSSKKAAPIAQVMQDTAGAIAANNPDFAALYDWVLSLEIPKPKATVQAPTGGAPPAVPIG